MHVLIHCINNVLASKYIKMQTGLENRWSPHKESPTAKFVSKFEEWHWIGRKCCTKHALTHKFSYLCKLLCSVVTLSPGSGLLSILIVAKSTTKLYRDFTDCSIGLDFHTFLLQLTLSLMLLCSVSTRSASKTLFYCFSWTSFQPEFGISNEFKTWTIPQQFTLTRQASSIGMNIFKFFPSF